MIVRLRSKMKTKNISSSSKEVILIHEDQFLFLPKRPFSVLPSDSNSDISKAESDQKITSIRGRVEGFLTLPTSADAERALSNSAESVPSPTRSYRAKNYVPST